MTLSVDGIVLCSRFQDKLRSAEAAQPGPTLSFLGVADWKISLPARGVQCYSNTIGAGA